jgi:hypothetical protein
VRAMVKIGSVGMGSTVVWLSRPDKALGNYAFLSVLHSPRDTFAAINMRNYAKTFRLISTFLGLIDQLLE